MQKGRGHSEREIKMTLNVPKCSREKTENVRKHRMSEKYKTETKEAVRLRKRKSRAMKRLQKENDTPVLATPPLADDPPSTYSHRSSLSRAVNKAISSLPGTPRRNKQVIHELALRVKLDFSKSKKRQSSRKALTEKTIQTVKTFYLCDDVSRWNPGKRDTIVVKENHVKQTMQRRYLQLSINELHAQFISENPSISIGTTKFRSLKPKHVLYASQTPRNMCLCTIHENMRLLFESANRHSKNGNIQIPLYNRDIVNEIVCAPPSHSCYYNQCDNCNNGQLFIENYPLSDVMSDEIDNRSDFSSNSDESDDDFEERRMKWHKWKRVPNPVGKGEHMVKLASYGTFADLYKEIVEGLPNFIRHVMLKRVQAKASQVSRANVGGEQAFLQVDFAENYNCVWQDEIQSAHWGKVNFVVCFHTS